MTLGKKKESKSRKVARLKPPVITLWEMEGRKNLKSDGPKTLCSHSEMKTDELRPESLTVTLSELRQDLLPFLIGNVFHLTTSLGFIKIKKDGLIRNNNDGTLSYTYPQSERSYARARGWVSLFDLRTVSDNQLEKSLSNFYFSNPPFVNNNPIFLFLSPLHHSLLLPWAQARDEDAWKEMFIPHIEAFYPGDIPLSHINRVVQVTVVD